MSKTASRPKRSVRPGRVGAASREKARVPTGERANARAGSRAQRAAERRDAILAAALEEFSVRGFAATRLDDVARRAGVAKGTIYLYFADKEALFEEIIRAELSPVVSALVSASHADIPVRQFAGQLVEMLASHVFETRRKDVIRLVITEGSRFPKLAEFYYREVVSRVIEAARELMRRAIERGELDSDVLLKFPQLLVAPGIVAVIWNGLFGTFEPLDFRAMMRAHLEILFGGRRSA